MMTAEKNTKIEPVSGETSSVTAYKSASHPVSSPAARKLGSAGAVRKKTEHDSSDAQEAAAGGRNHSAPPSRGKRRSSDKRRLNRSITVRVTPVQHDTVFEQAQAQGFSTPGAYIRALALDPPEARSRALKVLLGEMGRGGHRLTELARQLDAQAAPCPALEAQLPEVLDFLRFTLGEILTEVRALR